MFNNLTTVNFDLLSVGIAIAAIALLGFFIYYNNRKSITNRSFLYLSFTTILWGISNYLEYKFQTITSALWALRIHLFISVWHALTFFMLAYVFPQEKISFPKWYKYFLVPTVLLTAILTLTPLVFTRIVALAPIGEVTNPERGPGIILFSIVAFGLLISGIVSLIKKTISNKGVQRRQTIFVLLGMVLMACLILLFNLILPLTFNNLRFIPLAALFVLPFVALTSYSIYKHRLFNVKVAGTAVITFLLAVVIFIEIIFSDNLLLIAFRSGIFILVLIFGINLLRGVLKEVQQREQIENLAKDLENANMHLKDLDKMKTEFVSLATHQIRAPLTAIKGYISLIQEGDYGPVSPEIEQAVKIIFNETNSLVTIVADFLDVSRIEQGRMKYEFSDFDAKELVEDVIKEYKPNVEKKGLQFKYTVDSTIALPIHADKGKLKQVVGNILDNSIKYTPSGSITLSLMEKEGKAYIEISDTGVGIPKTTIPKLFQKFTRASNANETNILGTGLGLYVAKNMMESMHGKVWAESEGEGKGAQFYIELPLISGTQHHSHNDNIHSVELESAFNTKS